MPLIEVYTMLQLDQGTRFTRVDRTFAPDGLNDEQLQEWANLYSSQFVQTTFTLKQRE